MNQQVVRLAIAVGLGGTVFVAARHYFIPPTFGDEGHYRASAVPAIASHEIKFAGRAECNECHKEKVTEARGGNHKGVSCEVCHGPAFGHADAGGDVKTVAFKPRELCPVCHAYNASRPTGFPQIDPVDHNAPKVCTKCHNPHAPVPPRVPNDCKACHGQIARAKGMSMHARLPCADCHVAPEQHKVTPHSVLVSKPTEVSYCVKCHAQPDVSKQADATQIKTDTHYKRNLCWDCHYPHNPKAS